MRTSITVPRLGEGMREARIVAQLKRSGERVRKDEGLVEVETDKAIYVIESPCDGLVGAWVATEGETCLVGSLIVEVESSAECAPTADLLRNRDLSPQLKAYCRKLGWDDDVIRRIPRSGPSGSIQLSDIERWAITMGTVKAPARPADDSMSARQRMVAQQLK